MQDALLPKEEQMQSSPFDGGTELIPELAFQVKAPSAPHGSKSPHDLGQQLYHKGPKAQKADYFQTPGRSSSEFRWSSPFADPPAQFYTEPVGNRQTESSPPKFIGARQPSLQDWCDGNDEITAKRTKSALTHAQSLKLTPHGSPKLSRPGIPIFAPGAPQKPSRRSMGDVPITDVVNADSLSDLLSCDEDLGLSWGAVRGSTAESFLRNFPRTISNGSIGSGSFDSLTMKLAS